MDDDAATCGKGLAEHSALPRKLAELEDALAANLELHQRTLDLSDDNARAELDAYVRLAREHRAAAQQLRDVAAHMASYRSMPMARHDERALADPQLFEAFATFVRVEEELLTQLQAAVERDRTMLVAASRQQSAV